MFGKVISVNYQEYDCAKILVLTDCLFDINCKIALEIEGDYFPVHVSEVKFQIYHACSVDEVKGGTTHQQDQNSSDEDSSCKGSPIIAPSIETPANPAKDNLEIPPIIPINPPIHSSPSPDPSNSLETTKTPYQETLHIPNSNTSLISQPGPHNLSPQYDNTIHLSVNNIAHLPSPGPVPPQSLKKLPANPNFK